jgi:hypothetical protein
MAAAAAAAAKEEVTLHTRFPLRPYAMHAYAEMMLSLVGMTCLSCVRVGGSAHEQKHPPLQLHTVQLVQVVETGILGETLWPYLHSCTPCCPASTAAAAVGC